MHRLTYYIIGLILHGSIGNLYSQTNPSELLTLAEQYRAPWEQMQITAELIGQDPRGREKKSTYKVFFKDQTKTLAGFVEPRFEKGNLLLMVEDDLWYYVRDTKRPTRITPIQRLSGAVSYGDLARLSWNRDYTIDQFTAEDQMDNKTYSRFDLVAKTGAATYQTIQLWVNPSNKKPIVAKVYLLSGKHYKTIHFTKYEDMDGKNINTEMKFIDHLRKEETTILSFKSIKQEKNIPDRYFIKTYLPDLSTEVIE